MLLFLCPWFQPIALEYFSIPLMVSNPINWNVNFRECGILRAKGTRPLDKKMLEISPPASFIRRVTIMGGVWIEKVIIWGLGNVCDTFSELSLTALSNLLGLEDVMCLIKSPSSLTQRPLTSFQISQDPKRSWQLKRALLQHTLSALPTNPAALFSTCTLPFSPEATAELLHPLLTLHHADKAPGFNGTMKIRIFIYFNTYETVTICINEFSVKFWICILILEPKSASTVAGN